MYVYCIDFLVFYTRAEMDYSQLPEEILAKIVEDHLHSFHHLIAFSHVCKSWRIAARQPIIIDSGRCPRPPGRLGLLLSRNYSDSHEFLPLTNFAAAIAPPPPPPLPPSKRWKPPPPPRRRLTLHRRLVIPVGYHPDDCYDPETNPRVASKDGWILVIEPGRPSPDDDPLQLQLLNPVTRRSIALPPLLLPPPPAAGPRDPKCNILKAIISSDCCYVFLLFECNYLDDVMLACSKVEGGGGQNWKFSSLEDPPVTTLWHGDACYFGGKLYVSVGARDPDDAAICVIDNLTTTPTVAASIPLSPAMHSLFVQDLWYISFHTNFIHLCHLNGQLLVVFRRYPPYGPRHPHPDPVAFYVYKLSEIGSGGDYRWEEVRDLDGHALFLGLLQPAVCLPASDYDGVQQDRIYFAFPYRHGYSGSYGDGKSYNSNCGVFSLVDQRVETFARRPPLDQHNYNFFWFILTPSDVFSSSTVQDFERHRLIKRERLRLRKRRQRQSRKAFAHRINYAEIAGNGEHPQSCQGSYNYRHTDTTTTMTNISVPLEWTTPKKTMKNHHHDNKRSNNNVILVDLLGNRFQTLDVEEEEEEDIINLPR